MDRKTPRKRIRMKEKVGYIFDASRLSGEEVESL